MFRLVSASIALGSRLRNVSTSPAASSPGNVEAKRNALGRVVEPALPGVEAAVVEPGQERTGVHRSDLDAELLELGRHRLRDGFHRVLGGGVEAGERVDVQPFTRRDPHDPAFAALDHLPDDPLGEQQRRDDVDLELVAHVVGGNVDHRAAFQHARVVDEDLHVPVERFAPVALARHVELLDAERDAALLRLVLEDLDLRVDLDGRDHVEALPREPERHFVAEARSCPGDKCLPHEPSP